jgi:uncharacterized protein YgbK (DUF1537 family)
LPCQGGTAIAMVVAKVPRHLPAVRHVLADAVGDSDSRAIANAVCNCAQRTPSAGPAKELMRKRTRQAYDAAQPNGNVNFRIN